MGRVQHGRFIARCAFVLVALAASATAAGTWGNPGTSSITASADSSYLLGPPLCGRLPACIDAQSAGAFVPGFAGRDFGTIAHSECGASVATCPVIGRGFARATGEGLGTSQFIARWKVVAQTLHECECGDYEAHGAASLATSITVRVDTVPPGQPVTIYYSWWSFVLTNYDPEVPPLPDDPASVDNVTLKLQGTDLIPSGSANFVNVAAAAYLPAPGQPATGMILAQGGDVITIDIAADVLAEIRTPPLTPFLNQDQSWASYQGALVLSIDQPLPSLPTPGFANGLTAFSLDIGSDTEISDVNQDGDEVFDPGDVYRWYGPALPPNGADGFRDDAEIFTVDYWPQAPNTPPPFTGAAVCSGALPAQIPGLVDDRFDLDGTDFLAISLRDYIPPDSPLNQPVPAFNTNCIYGVEYLVVSFDDDDAWHYAGAGCDIPVAALSPLARTYGTLARSDEVVGVNLALLGPAMPAAPAAFAGALYAIHDEVGLHPSLAPSPDLQEADDDDVDALDLALDPCEFWYFSPDHEAVGAFMFAPLNPGAIYEVLGPPSYGHVKVIDPVIHLGLLPGTDIDAFEFVWLEYNDQGQRAFALLFSVDNDDPMTLGVDESGGLDPRMLYASYLTGVSFPLLASPLSDDVDALTAIPRPLVARRPCLGDSNCDGVVNWRDIDFFVAAMNDNVADWTAMFAPGVPTCAFANNDVNGDGTVNWRDIDPLVAVMNTVCP